MYDIFPILIPWLSFFWSILGHLSQLISASTSLYHSCTYHNPVTLLFPALSRIPPANSTATFVPQTSYRHISALTPPFSIFISSVCYQLHSRLLLFNCIIVIYMHRGYRFMLCYFYLVFHVVKHFRVIFLDKTLYKFWYCYKFDKSERKTTYLHVCGLHVA